MRNERLGLVVILGAAAAACSSAGGADTVDSDFGGGHPPLAMGAPRALRAGAYVNPPGFTGEQTSQVAMAPGVFIQEGDAVVTATTLLRRSRRARAGLAADAPSDNAVDDFRLEATIANDYSGGIRVNTSSRPLAYVELVPAGSSRAKAAVRDDGAIVAFENAFPNVTSAIGAREKQVEELLLIPSPSDIPPLAYEVRVGPEFGWWDEEHGQLYAYASDGRGLFAIAPPVAIDASGTRVEGAWAFTPDATGAGTLTARLDMSALTFPVVFDPNFVQPEWYPETKAGAVITNGFASATGFYDTTDGCVGLYGGADGRFVMSNNVYLRCNGTWSSPALNGTTVPPTRGYAAGTWATGIAGQPNGLYVFGGYGGPPANIDTLGDFWVGSYAGGKWTWKQIPLPATGAPAPRFMAGMTMSGGKLYLFGGVSKTGALLTDTWTFNGTTWTSVCASCFPEGGTSAKGRYAFASTVVAGTTYVVGGWDGSAYPSTVYTLSGGAWSQVTTLDEVVPTDINGSPSATGEVHPAGRAAGWVSASGAAGKNLVFGSGFTSTNFTPTFFYDAWSLFMDSSLVPVSPTPTWSRMPAPNPATAGADPIPGDRAGASAIYDAKLAEVLLIGGTSSKPSSSVQVNARRYKEAPQLITLTVTCQDQNRDGRCATPGVDNYLLSVYYDLDPTTGAPNPISELYFVQKAANVWATALGVAPTSCGTAAAPLQGPAGQLTGTLTCTVRMAAQTSFGVFNRDATFGPSAACAAKDAGAICDVSTVYPGVSTCSAALPTNNNSSINCN